MKLFKAIITSSLVLGITATSLSADAVKGQKLFTKLLEAKIHKNKMYGPER